MNASIVIRPGTRNHTLYLGDENGMTLETLHFREQSALHRVVGALARTGVVRRVVHTLA